ncbi:MAG TPA: tetraacyldisaccharide 4'-kinase [Pyrinomonadaceae bacterium]|nr:tetraacyldisaccharide 4'-kinase [Pyrinomonadaceae bacterium]
MKPSLVLSPLSVAYAAATRLRIAAYKKGLLKTTQLPVPVISIGNITVGGTGKTPLVALISRLLAHEGRKVCILTRGYGRKNATERILVSNGSEVLAHLDDAGDEPLWLAENLKDVAAVLCDPDRAAAGHWAIEQLGANVLVLDDGFQHLQLARDLNLLAIDATNPWGSGRLLPSGRLREAPRGAARADCAIITRAELTSTTQELKTKLQELLGERPIFTSHMQTTGVRELSGRRVDPGSGIAQPVAAFCAVGNPDSFFQQLRREGLSLAHTSAFPDHHQYTQAEITRLSDDAKRAGAASLITTAKDAVKLHEFEFSLPCYVLEIEISIDEEDRLRDLIRAAISSR